MTCRAWTLKEFDRTALKELTAAIAEQNTEELEQNALDDEPWSEQKYAATLAAQQKEAGLLAGVLAARGITDPAEALTLLAGEEELSDPMLLTDMDKACARILEAIDKEQTIVVYGDYDVDGVTSSHLFLTALRRVGAKVDVVIPHRIQDGYGLSLHLLQQAKEDGVDTILTCDNGIAAIDEIAWAKAQKMTVLVTDHHAVPFEEHEGRRTEKKSLADAVVNPHQQDCGYPYKELCGAGVAWNVIRVLYENYDMDKREAEDLLDFVAMATVCDVMSLTGENRILVKEGLKRIRHTKNIGLQALMQACNVQPENISAYHFGYVLGPCVNATGRLDTARHALRLFETGQETEAEEIARDLVDLNQERKELTLQGVEMAKKLCEEGGYENDPVLVLFLPDVHESIAGLIAGIIREMYNRPVFVLTRGESKAAEDRLKIIPCMKICVDVWNCLQNLADIRWRQGYPFQKKMWKNSAEKLMKTVRLRWRKSARIFTLTWPCRWDMRVRNWSISLHFWSRLEKTIHLHCLQTGICPSAACG